MYKKKYYLKNNGVIVENSNVKNNFLDIRKRTVLICKPLSTEDYGVQVATFASPAKWHLAHTTWFFETFILKQYVPDYKEFHKDYNFLFNSYYNNAGERVFRSNRGNITRPGVQEIYEYRAYVDEAMLQLMANDKSNKLVDLIALGLNHEQQHQELLFTDIKYMLGHNPLFPVYDADTNLLNNEKNEPNGFITVSEGIYEIGYKGNGFCYDNELGVHKVYLNDFEISKTLVTNGEYLQFMEDAGYSNFNLWLDEGWTWIQENNVSAPLYWHKIDSEWCYYTLKGLQKINPNEIVKHISFYEAAAFAEWKGMRLPTEFEWEIASDRLRWGQRWEWTNSAYLPYPNFRKAEGAIGEYNGKFMINQMVLRGASIVTSPNHSRKTYRNFFHPDARWQFTGIRLAK